MHASASRNDESARGWRSHALWAAAVAALLASAACGPTPKAAEPSDPPSGTASADPSGTVPATPSRPASADPGGTGGSDDKGNSSGGSDDKGSDDKGGSSSGGKGGSRTVATCTTQDLAVSATKEPADSKGARHLLLTVQNAGTRTCNVYRYPYVKIGDAQAPTPVIKDSDPDPGKPVTLAPGKEAYAALLVAGGGRDEYDARSITLGLQGSTSGSTTGKTLDVPLPVSTLPADDGQLVTYWTTASGYALDFVMSK